MARKRMFNPEIVESDAFLEMPLSTQALYFHFGVNADDDGFVNPKRIMRIVGAQDDDLKVLIGKRFVLPFKNGMIVIKHWRMNNYIRKDRYKPTVYLEEKTLLFIKENGSYTEDKTQGQPVPKGWLSFGQPTGDVDKNSIDKNIYNISYKKKYYWKPYNQRIIKVGEVWKGWFGNNDVRELERQPLEEEIEQK